MRTFSAYARCAHVHIDSAVWKRDWLTVYLNRGASKRFEENREHAQPYCPIDASGSLKCTNWSKSARSRQ
jgi:hypothetical protein